MNQYVRKQVAIDGHQVYYLEGGMESNLNPIIFIHGWGVSVEPYQEIIHILCQDYRVIAPVLPGFGKSDGDNLNWDYDDYAKFLLEFLQVLNIQKFHLIGHSLGGGIGATLAVLCPEVVSSLVLVDSTGIPIKPVPIVFFKRLFEMTAQLPQIKFPQLLQIFQGFTYNIVNKTSNTIQALFLSLQKDIKHILPKIETPCLIVWGANDCTTPLVAGKEFHRNIKNSRLVVIERGYHEWSIFLVEEFTTIVLSFIYKIEQK